MLFIIAGSSAYAHYQEYPGTVGDINIADRGANFIRIEWEAARNADEYIVSADEKTFHVDGGQTDLLIPELDEGTEYEISVKAVRCGHDSNTSSSETSTKKTQSISGKTVQMKLSTAENLDLGLSAETEIEFPAAENDLSCLTPGEMTVTAKAVETDEYESEELDITLEVLDSVEERPEAAELHELYYLNTSNCELVREVKGTKEASVPQSFTYLNGKYYIAYGMDDAQRIISFDDSKNVSVPKEELGHPNGLTSDGSLCYCVQGYSGRCVTYSPETEEYDVIYLPSGASGIAYDKETELFYTSSRTGHTVYTKDLEKLYTIAPVRHDGEYYTQDCGGCSGIMMHCISDKTKHGTNYIDLYDMINGYYLGSIRCELDEVESVLTDEEGYLEILSNVKGDTDYIWKSPVNIYELGGEILTGYENRDS